MIILHQGQLFITAGLHGSMHDYEIHFLAAQRCKGRLPPMYRVFLDMCTGVLEGGLLTVYAPDDITLGRLDNDRVRNALMEEAASGGVTVRLVFQVGEPPKATPRENLQNLLKFGSQFDNIEIK